MKILLTYLISPVYCCQQFPFRCSHSKSTTGAPVWGLAISHRKERHMSRYDPNISFSEMENFFLERGYAACIPEGWSEMVFTKYTNCKEMYIRVGSTFDSSGQRERGKDAIRCQLLFWNGKPIWTMSHTKRLRSWRANLIPKLEPLEEVLAAGRK